MISISTVEVPCQSNRDQFFDQIKDLSTLKQILGNKRTSDVQIEGDYLSFIVKNVARFYLKPVKSPDHNYIQFESGRKMQFQTAMRFEFSKENQAYFIHLETDTNVFMELFLEKRLKKWLSAVTEQIKSLKL